MDTNRDKGRVFSLKDFRDPLEQRKTEVRLKNIDNDDQSTAYNDKFEQENDDSKLINLIDEKRDLEELEYYIITFLNEAASKEMVYESLIVDPKRRLTSMLRYSNTYINRSKDYYYQNLKLEYMDIYLDYLELCIGLRTVMLNILDDVPLDVKKFDQTVTLHFNIVQIMGIIQTGEVLLREEYDYKILKIIDLLIETNTSDKLYLNLPKNPTSLDIAREKIFFAIKYLMVNNAQANYNLENLQKA